MTTSVAMCTYNGAKFIKEQLDSILAQSHPVDEIVICDDGSTDETISIVKEYAVSKSNKIRLFQNNSKLGVCANFAKAISLCTKDIIFLADQDDIWKSVKVQNIIDYFKYHPSFSVVFTNAILIDENNREFTDLSLFDAVGLSEQLYYFDKGFGMEIFLQDGRAYGCTMALRKDFVPFVEIDENAKLNSHEQIHDSNLAMSAIVRNALGYIAMPLMYYRQYSSQSCGLGTNIVYPPHYPSPIKLIGDYNVEGYFPLKNLLLSTQNSARVEMQNHRKNYIYQTGVLTHLRSYYKAYGKLMWEVVYADVKRRIRYLLTKSEQHGHR